MALALTACHAFARICGSACCASRASNALQPGVLLTSRGANSTPAERAGQSRPSSCPGPRALSGLPSTTFPPLQDYVRASTISQDHWERDAPQKHAHSLDQNPQAGPAG